MGVPMSMGRRAAAFGLAVSVTVATAWAQAPAPVKPMATVDMSAGEAKIDLMSVDRKGSVLTVKWQVRNAGAQSTRVRFALSGNNATTYAVDEESGTKYYALTDKEKHTLASAHEDLSYGSYGIDDNIAAGATARYWMKLPAPPPAVKTITIFFTKAEPFESVAISDK
jgi:hypothetical protein